MFDDFDFLYAVYSDKNLSAYFQPKPSLFQHLLYQEFKSLTNIFHEYGNIGNVLFYTYDTPKKLYLPKYNSRNIIVCFSGGKDSLATVLHYKKLGYNVYLYHLKGINKAYPKEYEQAEKLADALNLMLYTENISLSGTHTYTEHPMKNMIIANRALQFGIRHNIGVKVAFGDYYTAMLDDNVFDICAGDCRDMWNAYENIIKTIIPKFHIYTPLRNVKTTLKALEAHKDLLNLCCSCMAPYRYREYWKRNVEKKYNIILPQNRCGLCWKCALEYIYYADHNVWEYQENYYIHCLEVLLHNSKKENKKHSDIYDLWSSYLFYEISKSKWEGIRNAIVQGRKIKYKNS